MLRSIVSRVTCAALALGLAYTGGSRIIEAPSSQPTAATEAAVDVVARVDKDPGHCAAPPVRPGEACFFSGTCYQGLLACVKAGESLSTGGARVHSVVVGKDVSVANTTECQFYGPDADYAAAEAGCSTDRLWVAALSPSTGS